VSPVYNRPDPVPGSSALSFNIRCPGTPAIERHRHAAFKRKPPVPPPASRRRHAPAARPRPGPAVDHRRTVSPAGSVDRVGLPRHAASRDSDTAVRRRVWVCSFWIVDRRDDRVSPTPSPPGRSVSNVAHAGAAMRDQRRAQFIPRSAPSTMGNVETSSGYSCCPRPPR
jgi:hypothetical protein